MYDDALPVPGDLGRRVADRRRRCGLSRAELAARAGVSTPYLSYLETHPANVTTTCLMGLADALETTAEALLGASPTTGHAEKAPPGPAGMWVADVRTGRRGERPGPFLG
jgi:transcriptional regulator with XRE-family HTH domain